MSKSRVESFSDGVFAVAITLPVLGVPIPRLERVDDQQLRRPHPAGDATLEGLRVEHDELHCGCAERDTWDS